MRTLLSGHVQSFEEKYTSTDAFLADVEASKRVPKLDHAANSDPCTVCGIPAYFHLPYAKLEKRRADKKGYEKERRKKRANGKQIDREIAKIQRQQARELTKETAKKSKAVDHIPGPNEAECDLCGNPASEHPNEDELLSRYVGIDGEGHDICASCKAPWQCRCPGCQTARDDSFEACLCGEPWSAKAKRCFTCGHDRTRHLYTYLCAVNGNGDLLGEVRVPPGEAFTLSHDECIEMLLDLPKKAKKFGYMISYDLTKILEEMPDEPKYKLLRPDCRQMIVCPGHGRIPRGTFCKRCGELGFSRTIPIFWRNRHYDYFNGAFMVRDAKAGKDRRSVKVWDVFRFFGCAFVEALKAWRIGTPAQIKRIADMKSQRGSFAHVKPKDIEEYCREECELLAKMMYALDEAHVHAGWRLRRYEGAGSTGSAMLRANGVEQYKSRAKEWPKGLRHAALCAFFGGRFENSWVGAARTKIYGRDIASAYPYAMTGLPCLACGSWKRVIGQDVERAVRHARVACVRFRVKNVTSRERRAMAWAPLPYRDEKGSIAYPVHFKGWAWKDEVLAAIEGWPGLVTMLEAWVYETTCKHKPFGFLPDVYKRRIQWGKKGRGIVLKLGSNAGYGKTAQAIGGGGRFTDIVWAGCITSHCRAQALRALCTAKDRWNVVSIATDGLYALEELKLEGPKDTGTSGLKDPETGEAKSALGAWEEDDDPDGVFFIKPGMYYSLKGEYIRARGIGRKELLRERDAVIAGFQAWDRQDTKYALLIPSRRFYGAKTSIYAASMCRKGHTWPGAGKCPWCHRKGVMITRRQTDEKGRDVYGLWGTRVIQIKFDPHPKRERNLAREGEFVRMHVRDVGGKTSQPYDGHKTPEIEDILRDEEMLAEQPDGDSYE